MEHLKMKDWAPHERPRERFVAKGPSALSDIELIAILLRTGTKDCSVMQLSQLLLQQGDNKLQQLSRQNWELMASLKGMGLSKAITIAAAFELGRRAHLPGPELPKVSCAEDVACYMIPLLRDLAHEECWVLFLNGGRRVIAKEQISSGGINATVVDTRIILKSAIQKLACELILVHNHPSGNTIPGKSDRLMTRRLKEAAAVMDVQLIDHIVIGCDSYYSFAESGIL